MRLRAVPWRALTAGAYRAWYAAPRGTQVTWLELRRGSCQLRYADARDAEHVAKVLNGAR